MPSGGSHKAAPAADQRSAFSYFRDSYVENMERMFAAVSDLYAATWNDFFHFALFENDKESWDAAFERTHQQYVEALRVDRAASVIDLACGRGGFANVLAQNTAGDVLGIDISQSQLAHCGRFQRPNLRFLRRDIMTVHELDCRFDAVALLDADCYLPDKRLAIKRIASVMRPGARFLLLSWCKRSGLSSLQEELVLYPFMLSWGIPSLATPESYQRAFERSGLNILELADLNAVSRRNWDFGYDQALSAVQELSAMDLPRLIWKGLQLGPEGVRLVKEQFAAALYIKAGFDAGFLRYTYVLAEKP